MSFVHVHVHSHFSVLDGMSKISELVDKAINLGMPALALTDHGHMYGAKEFTDYAKKATKKYKEKVAQCQEELAACTDADQKVQLEQELEALKAKAAFKPIIGVEAYCARRTLYNHDKNFKATKKNGREYIVDSSGHHLILLAKNKTGYKNLCKLVSIANIDGFYNRPRIDKNILEKYHQGLIVCSACLAGELSQLILDEKYEEAEAAARWFKNLFGEDYYIELQRHQTDKPDADTEVFEQQQLVLPHLVNIAQKVGVKIIASNDVHFVDEDHAEAHDRLICLSTGKKMNEPRMHYSKQEWLKSPAEMTAIFPDYPEAIANTLEIGQKVEVYSIESGPIMPMFEIPTSFGTEEEYRKKFSEKDLFEEFTRNEKGEVVLSEEKANEKIERLGGYEKLYRIKLEADYLAKLAWEGAAKRYGDELTDEQKERIIFELYIMKTMGFPGYFLIVQDYIRAAREELGVSVGPGRGSAAGSVVAYCLRITDVDPLKYDLLFERFLNPDRISLPDIDVDFDDDGRGAVLDWVTEKYGKEKVAHIITYGSMATKSSIKDVGRVQDVPLPKVNEVVSMVPDKFGDQFADPVTQKVPKVTVKNCVKLVPSIHQLRYGNDVELSSMLEYAGQLEGTVRQIGIHACGVIIGADDLTNFAPLTTVKDKVSGEDIVVTEYDGHVVESVGLIKMDFLGLSTLSIIKEALKNIKLSKGIDVDIDAIPIDDEATYKLYSEGRTIGTFQFESPGMQKYLRELQPTVFEDLIAMNALYRPGPMDYIPQFIARKQGREPISYDIPIMEKYLKDTYGITVYQEQVMLLSRLLAGFTRGQSDALRKAMGKKIIAILNELKGKFIEGGKKNGHDETVLEKIWADWEKFASYAFNKSHATCYSWVAYQTAYLKAHYPAEFMAANLTRNKDDIKEVTKFMQECKSMGISVLGPNINESFLHFTSDKDNNIRFGLGGVKGVGEGAVEAILKERAEHGPFKNSFDFFERINLSNCNRKAIESLVLAGAFDSMGDITREQFFVPVNANEVFLDQLMRYANKFQNDNCMQGSLFDDLEEIEIQRPIAPAAPETSSFERLNKEKDLVGIYLSAHPLDDYKTEIAIACNADVDQLNDAVMLEKQYGNANIVVAGVVRSVEEIMTKRNTSLTKYTIEGYAGEYTVVSLTKKIQEFKHLLFVNSFVVLTGKLEPTWRAIKAQRNQQKGVTEVGDNPDEKEFSVSRIDELSSLKGAVGKKLTLRIPLDIINDEMINAIQAFVNVPPKEGQVAVEFLVDVFDPITGMTINSRGNYPILLTEELLSMLKSWREADDSRFVYFVEK
ncbi:MAG: DNA polymerase III subunit alpha [Paludibacteraceae bacterium]|nr:DNA polymerase III subunit alpha [Paludibacteraceae bacterium]